MSLYNQLHTVVFHVIAKSSVYCTFRLFVRCSGRFAKAEQDDSVGNVKKTEKSA